MSSEPNPYEAPKTEPAPIVQGPTMKPLARVSLVLSTLFLILGVLMTLMGETTPGCILVGSALISLAIHSRAK